MATGQEWREYFEKKSIPYLKKQLRIISMVANKLDDKIQHEFQLAYLASVSSIIKSVIETRK